MTSGSILHVVGEIATDRPSTAPAPGSLASSTGSASSSTSKLNKKASRRRRTSDTLLATASAILKMLGVTSASSTTAAAAAEEEKAKDFKLNGGAVVHQTKQQQQQQQQQKQLQTTGEQPEKEMPAMQREKSASLSETDYAELQKSRAAVEAKAAEHKEREASESSTETPASASAQRQKSAPTRRSVNDFRFGKSIGEGSFSTVYLCKDIHTGKECAIKTCDKAHIIREKKQEYIKREREVMNVMSGCPGFVSLYCTFQDQKNLYFVMTYAKNGDMLPHINKVGSFDLECTRFYAAELVLALENMHKRGVIHRDLKPENVLLDEKMHTLIADFGSAKLCEGGVTPKETPAQTASTSEGSEEEPEEPAGGRGVKNPRYQRGRRNSFVGTAQYVSPEVLKGQPASAAVDLWALGCILYQMVSGLPPFRGGSEYLIFQTILKQELSFPEGFDAQAKDLVERLLVLDPCARLGAKDRNRYDSIREHAFFAGIDWERVREQTPPKIHPNLPGLEEEGLARAYNVPDHLEPGLGEKQLTRLLGLDLGGFGEGGAQERRREEERGSGSESGEEEEKKMRRMQPKSIANLSEAEKEARLEKQKTDKWNAFAEGELILKQGFVSKRKGLFARKRMLLLTTGPRLIYIDPTQMVKKGEIPWSEELWVEPKNFKIFFVHTPNRTYYLEDPDGFALRWCDAIKDVFRHTYGFVPTGNKNAATSGGAQNGGSASGSDRVTDYRYSSQ